MTVLTPHQQAIKQVAVRPWKLGTTNSDYVVPHEHVRHLPKPLLGHWQGVLHGKEQEVAGSVLGSHIPRQSMIKRFGGYLDYCRTLSFPEKYRVIGGARID